MKALQFRTMPTVLTKNDLLRETGKTDEVLKISINRWVKKGYLRKAGARAGIYYNLVADPQWQNHVLEAVEKKYPSAILAGPSVLHAHSLQTQIPAYFYVAVLAQRSLVEMDLVQWMPRSKTWFRDFVPKDQLYGIRSLSPEQALEDGLKHQHQDNAGWVPDLDDIDLDEMNMDVEKYTSTHKKSQTP